MGSLLRVGVAEKALVEFVTAPVPAGSMVPFERLDEEGEGLFVNGQICGSSPRVAAHHHAPRPFLRARQLSRERCIRPSTAPSRAEDSADSLTTLELLHRLLLTRISQPQQHHHVQRRRRRAAVSTVAKSSNTARCHPPRNRPVLSSASATQRIHLRPWRTTNELSCGPSVPRMWPAPSQRVGMRAMGTVH